MFFAAPPPPPVSFSREIAPIMAMHCNGCHGAASGLSTRSYRELMMGGNLGKSVVPGDSKRSLLLDFLEGRRGERHRMPKDGRPLSAEQIAVIRRWIDQGAKNDNVARKAFRIVRSGVPVDATRVTRVLCRVNTTAYLTVIAKDPSLQTILWKEAASLKSPKEANDAGEPGATLFWDLRAGANWPATIELELIVQYATEEPSDIEFRAYMLEP